MSCGVNRRRGSDPEFLWLWCRPVATAPIRPLAWERPHAMDVVLKSKKKKKKKEFHKKNTKKKKKHKKIKHKTTKHQQK